MAQEDITEVERFQLWTDCRPMALFVHRVCCWPEEAGLTEEKIQAAVRRRLRLSRLYAGESPEEPAPILIIDANISNSAYSAIIMFAKYLIDPAVSAEKLPAITWYIDLTGMHGPDVGIDYRGPGYVMSQLLDMVDDFLDIYLRVNETSCSR